MKRNAATHVIVYIDIETLSFLLELLSALTQPMFGPVLTPALTSLLAKRNGPIVNKEIPMIVTSKTYLFNE